MGLKGVSLIELLSINQIFQEFSSFFIFKWLIRFVSGYLMLIVLGNILLPSGIYAIPAREHITLGTYECATVRRKCVRTRYQLNSQPRPSRQLMAHRVHQYYSIQHVVSFPSYLLRTSPVTHSHARTHNYPYGSFPKIRIPLSRGISFKTDENPKFNKTKLIKINFKRTLNRRWKEAAVCT